jgi:hypothetical protein
LYHRRLDDEDFEFLRAHSWIAVSWGPNRRPGIAALRRRRKNAAHRQDSDTRCGWRLDLWNQFAIFRKKRACIGI